jgi:hypothetical protein
MTINVVALPDTTPPSVRVTCSVTSGWAMSEAAVYRLDNGVPTLVRTQPATGFDTQIVTDYEAPYGVPSVYQFVADYFNPAAISTVWDEAWSNLTAWTGETNLFTVSGGLLRLNTTAAKGASIARTVPTGAYRVTVASMTLPGTPSDNSSCGVLIPGLVALIPSAGGFLQVMDYRNYSLTQTAISISSQFTIDCLGSTVVISGVGGTLTLSGYSTTTFSSVGVMGRAATSGVFNVGPIRVSSYPAAPSHVEQTSSPVTLSPHSAWLIHPSSPSLSMPISGDRDNLPSITSIGDVTNGSAATQHQILGSSVPITTVSGPRFSNEFTLGLMTKTRAHELALTGLLLDGSPLMVRTPATFDVGLDEGFYSVGDVTRSRMSQRPGSFIRNYTLPMTAVQAPIADIAYSGWSWASVAVAFTSWASAASAFTSWANLGINSRKSGY